MTAFWPLGVVTAVVVGRWLGPAGKGEYTLAALVGGLLLTLLNLGIPASISYFISGGRATESSFVKTVIVLAVILAGVGIVLTLALDRTGWCWNVLGIPRITRAMWLVVVALPFQFCGTFLQFVILAKGHRVLFAALPAVGQLVVSALIGAFVVLSSLTPFTAAMALVASQIVTAGILLAYVELRVRWWRAPLLGAATWKNLAEYSAVTYAANTLQFLIQRADVFMVSAWIDLRAVGLYSVSYGIAELLLLLPQRLGVLYLPRIAAERAPMGKAEEVKLSSSLVFVGTVVAAVIFSLIAPLAIRLFYGEAFGPSVTPFLLLLPGICGLSAACIQSAYLSGVGRVKTTAAIAGAGLGLNIILNSLLIPRYGISGAAVASSLTYCTQAFVLIIVVSRITNARPLAMLTSAPPAVVFGLLKRAFR